MIIFFSLVVNNNDQTHSAKNHSRVGQHLPMNSLYGQKFQSFTSEENTDPNTDGFDQTCYICI